MDVKGQGQSDCPVLCREEPRDLEKGRQIEGEVRGAVTEGYLRHKRDMADHNPTQGITPLYPAHISLFPAPTLAGAHHKTAARPVGL